MDSDRAAKGAPSTWRNALSAPPDETVASLCPRTSVRRFHVFAEYHRLTQLKRGVSPDKAAGYGLWLAKVVASHMWSEREQLRTHTWDSEGGQNWLLHKGVAQTEAMFDHEVVQSLGEDFYREVFAPAISKAVYAGQRYEDIRDSVRASWQLSSQRERGERKS